MAILLLNAGTIKDFDRGRLAAAFDLTLRRVVEDCRDRPGLAKSRKIVLEVEIEPVIDATGALENVRLNYSVVARTPKLQSGQNMLGVKQTGALYFSELAPDNPDQTTFTQLEGDE